MSDTTAAGGTQADAAANKGSDRTLYCSFCGKSQHEVKKLIAGPMVFICDECTALCAMICEDKSIPAEIGNPEQLPTQTLLSILKGAGPRDEALRVAMQNTVDVLRKREVSWAVIGEALGVSRQAAWDRFS
ncbi:MAG: hypothetical protein JO366_01565 [Methylobacteriaceae bacterium]|nr:hypothetical protein [Methylobacteriaceae bacterium]MBV9243480.1 hypothetical protein [Methylobacteriaceae bacterium]MBV9636077.1 hypothetical protein [Methylobacteriaceae bacterium]MBV9703272.1 hypothetical protein [Methylobacteriaceae bacterium]